MIGGTAFDSDELDEAMAAQETDVIEPHRESRRPENRTRHDRPPQPLREERGPPTGVVGRAACPGRLPVINQFGSVTPRAVSTS